MARRWPSPTARWMRPARSRSGTWPRGKSRRRSMGTSAASARSRFRPMERDSHPGAGREPSGSGTSQDGEPGSRDDGALAASPSWRSRPMERCSASAGEGNVVTLWDVATGYRRLPSSPASAGPSSASPSRPTAHSWRPAEAPLTTDPAPRARSSSGTSRRDPLP